MTLISRNGLIILAACLALAIAGCPGQSGKTGDGSGGGANVGGTLVYGFLEEPDNLNAYGSNMTYAIIASMLINNGLTTVNPDLEVVPDLATSVPTSANGGISEDGLKITYELREGVKWHDGEDFDCEDVKFTAETINDPAFIMPLSKVGYDKIEETECEDDHTVVFTLTEPYAPFVNLLFQTGIMPEHILSAEDDINKAEYNRSPVGTGPFRFVEWIPGEAITLERNADYWDEENRALLDQLIIRFAEDETTLFTQLKSGEVDVWDFVSPDLLATAEQDSEIEVLTSLQLTLESVHVNSSRAPLDDKRVRQALMYGWNRQATVETLYKGETLAATEQSPLCWCANEDLEPYPYDAEKAKALLAEAGWTDSDDDGFVDKDGTELSLTISTSAGKKDREQVQVIMQQDYKKVGIDLKIKNYDATTLFANFTEGGPLATGAYDLAIFADVIGVDPDSFYSVITSDGIPSNSNPSGNNWNYFANEELDDLIATGRRTVDQEERKKIYDEAQRILYDESTFLYERYPTFYTLTNKRVKGISPSPTIFQNMWNHGATWSVEEG